LSEEAMAVVKAFIDGMADGELRVDLLDPEIDVFDYDIPDAGSYHGHEGVTKWLVEDWGSAWDSYEVEPEELVDAGDVVVSIFTVVARGKGSGIETRRRNATVNTVENGLVARIAYYTTVEEARQAAGLTADQKG
jgi:ketosteroid isomerase-like protein